MTYLKFLWIKGYHPDIFTCGYAGLPLVVLHANIQGD
jgi:hypothetical protein